MTNQCHLRIPSSCALSDTVISSSILMICRNGSPIGKQHTCISFQNSSFKLKLAMLNHTKNLHPSSAQFHCLFVILKFMFHIFFSHSVSNWISSLSNEVIYSFQRAAEIGVELKESWLVCNSAVYLWNYATHMLSQGRHKEVIPIFSPVLEAVKLTGHAG